MKSAVGMQSTHGFVLGCCLALVLSGCEKPAPYQPYPVTGKVLVKGKPAVGAELAFFGLDDRLRSPDAPFPRATVDADGEFHVSSYEPNDGAPAGSYKVTVVWRRSTSDDPEVRDAAPDLLRGRYADPERSNVTVEVKPGQNVLPDIEL